jgi:hypothetical protein
MDRALSEWVMVWSHLYELELKNLIGSMSPCATLILKNSNVAQHMSCLHDKYVVVPADKAPNNTVLVCKSHYALLDKGIKHSQFTWQPYIHVYYKNTYKS